MPRKILILVALACAIMITVLTLSSVGLRPHFFPYPSLDRVFAFAILGLLAGTAFPRHLKSVLIWLILAAITLEALQYIRPGRDPRFFDAIAKCIGAALGVGLAWAVTTFLRNRQNRSRA